MQYPRKNSFEIKRNLHWRAQKETYQWSRWNDYSTSSCHLWKHPKHPSTGSSNCFHFTSVIGVFHLRFDCYRCQAVYNDVTPDSVTCSLKLRHATDYRCVKCRVHFFHRNIFYSLRCEQNFLTSGIAGKLMKIKKIKLCLFALHTLPHLQPVASQLFNAMIVYDFWLLLVVLQANKNNYAVFCSSEWKLVDIEIIKFKRG